MFLPILRISDRIPSMIPLPIWKMTEDLVSVFVM
jgi:hypothetical protein